MTVYDLAFVGSGISCSMTLWCLAERLRNSRNTGKPMRIAVIEKEGEMWNGIPYGRRSAKGALAFQKLHEFLEEPERGDYIRWLAANAHSWSQTLLQWGGPSAARWMADNRLLIEQRNWEELYLPRFLFGLYVSSQTARVVEELSKSRLATVTPIHGEASKLSRHSGDHYTIVVGHDRYGSAKTRLHAARVVLTIGSPPQKSLWSVTSSSPQGSTHIDDIYSPSEDFSVHKVQQALFSLADNKMANILIVGSNASALEVLYLLHYRTEVRNRINSIVVLSNSGLLPYKICDEPVQFELTALNTLDRRSAFSASELMAAITADIKRAEELTLNIADLRDPVGAAVSRLTARMHITEQEKFVCNHGNDFSRLMRRAGRDTRNAADELVRLGLLTVVQGELLRLAPCPSGNGLTSAVYAPAGSRSGITHPTPFSITINCGGFEKLNSSSSAFIRNLIEKQLCEVNRTNRGFVVNERMEAGKDLYVIGPLVAGNFNDKFRFWHVESASRITGLAKLLAQSLSESLLPARESPLLNSTSIPASAASSVTPLTGPAA